MTTPAIRAASALGLLLRDEAQLDEDVGAHARSVQDRLDRLLLGSAAAARLRLRRLLGDYGPPSRALDRVCLPETAPQSLAATALTRLSALLSDEPPARDLGE